MHPPGKPRLVIFSSTEALNVANSVQQALENDALTTVWNQGVFKPSATFIENLEQIQPDFAVMVLSPDDTVDVRGEKLRTPRQNVILEVGIMMQRLGRDRTFCLVPRSQPPVSLPSDLDGMVVLKYEPDRPDRNLLAAVGPACHQIRTEMRIIHPDTARNYAAEHPVGSEAHGEKAVEGGGWIALPHKYGGFAFNFVAGGTRLISKAGEWGAVAGAISSPSRADEPFPFDAYFVGSLGHGSASHNGREWPSVYYSGELRVTGPPVIPGRRAATVSGPIECAGQLHVSVKSPTRMPSKEGQQLTVSLIGVGWSVTSVHSYVEDTVTLLAFDSQYFWLDSLRLQATLHN